MSGPNKRIHIVRKNTIARHSDRQALHPGNIVLTSDYVLPHKFRPNQHLPGVGEESPVRSHTVLIQAPVPESGILDERLMRDLMHAGADALVDWFKMQGWVA